MYVKENGFPASPLREIAQQQQQPATAGKGDRVMLRTQLPLLHVLLGSLCLTPYACSSDLIRALQASKPPA